MATVTTLSVLLRADSTRLRRDLQASTRIVRREARNINRSINTALRATAIASAAAVAAIGRVAQVTIEYADALAKGARNAGIAAREFQSLRLVLQLAGGRTETLVKASVSLSRAITFAGDGLKTYQRELERLGLTYEDLAGLAPERQFALVVDALRGIEDAPNPRCRPDDAFQPRRKELGTLTAPGAASFSEELERIRSILPPLGEELTRFAERTKDNFTILRESALSGLTRGFLDELREATSELGQGGIDDSLRGIGEAAETAGRSLVRFGEFLFDNRVQLARIAEAILYYKVVTTAVFAGAALATILRGIGALTKALAGIAVTANAIVIVPALIAAALAAAVVALRHTSVDWDTVLDRMLISQRQFILQSRQLWEALSGFAADLFERLAQGRRRRLATSSRRPSRESSATRRQPCWRRGRRRPAREGEPVFRPMPSHSIPRDCWRPSTTA